MRHTPPHPTRRQARLVGVSYLAVAALAFFAILGARDVLAAPGDAAATLANLAANENLARLATLADLGQSVFFLFVGLGLATIFAQGSRLANRALLTLVAISVALQAIKQVPYLGAIALATDPVYAESFGSETVAGLTLLLVELHLMVFGVAQIFFGLWLFPLAYLIFTTALFPRVLGVLVLVAGVVYLVDVVLFVAAPEAAEALGAVAVIPTAIGEISMMLYLLIRGVRQPTEITKSAV